ncbi:hypothetical protein DVK85_10485 [Flavobacterium arcticum]|uniref:DUF4870 domain-containing protein n=1 Tax=Flavobacterium arcticum TaxID=1784713 RepID=A0A345HDH4_9FLAO|nr:hypothetical protein [Flavobacterium arcticum]AXG74634.1 hypothetical protein DVK85_10485 [Flavobacterium arcticum]KAF2512239.1 hypothetical protein E0W72_03180 [Flavobacterium arcticum]
MEHTERVITEEQTIHPNDYERASNSYLMAIVAVIVGLPLPIINIIASLMYYLGSLKSSYFVRWHCIQAILAQTIMIPFNSLAWGWTLAVILDKKEPTLYYSIYLFGVILFNIVEFFAVIITASKVGKGENVRWFLIANITDMLCSKKNKDPYRIY